MVIKTYFDKCNTIIKNSLTNTGLNPVAELFYGGPDGDEQYSRILFHFDETRLKALYDNGTFTDLTKLKHTLRLTNTGSFDTGLLNGKMDGKSRASSFDIVLFKINQTWDNGVGYDFTSPDLLTGSSAYGSTPSNWVEAQTGVRWVNGTGVYSDVPDTIATQHFDKGNENIEIDITDYVNGVLAGDVNYGLGIAYSRNLELTNSNNINYVGFFTNNTQTFYEPLIETVYSNHITDDRNNFFLDKPNKLYLYVNLAGNPTNLDAIPTVDVFDSNDMLANQYGSEYVTHVTKGIYSIDIIIPTNISNENTMYSDVWSGISIQGVSRPNISLSFVMKDSIDYYGIGDSDSLPKKVAINVSGIKSREKIKRGDVRKVIVSARIPYTVEQTQTISDLKYRLYVNEGNAELTVIDFQPIEMASNYYYFLIDTASLIPNTYYLDVLVTSNLEVTTIKNAIQFEIVNQVDLRKSQ